jgi:hypothetical protein
MVDERLNEGGIKQQSQSRPDPTNGIRFNENLEFDDGEAVYPPTTSVNPSRRPLSRFFFISL